MTVVSLAGSNREDVGQDPDAALRYLSQSEARFAPDRLRWQGEGCHRPKPIRRSPIRRANDCRPMNASTFVALGIAGMYGSDGDLLVRPQSSQGLSDSQ